MVDVRAILSGQRKDPLAYLLRGLAWLASIPYGVIVGLRNRRFDSGSSKIQHATVPVISIGNITAGGTGKTPMVAWLARYLRERGLRVALVSRGYGANDSGPNDEALELEDRLPDVPHVQNPNRVEAARVVVEEFGSQLILLDDGFQHRRLYRDLDIVLVDATCPFGFGRLLPRGLLREKCEGLSRADVVMLTRSDAIDVDRCNEIREMVRRYAPKAIWMESIHAPSDLIAFGQDRRSIETVRGQNVLAVSAIGNPDAFLATIGQCGGNVVDSKRFPDHHCYSREDVTLIRKWAEEYDDVDSIVCTHKDLVKLRTAAIGSKPLLALAIEISITTGEDELLRCVDGCLHVVNATLTDH